MSDCDETAPVLDVPQAIDDRSRPPDVPAAFYRDDEPPEPPEDDPHWQEFPLFDTFRGARLVVAAIVVGVCFATMAHLAILLFI
jgi:hypothetical protein